MSQDDRLALEALYFPLWCKNRVERVDNRNFDIQKFPYLEAIYDDESIKIYIEKAAQMGMTVWAILKSCHHTWAGMNWLYFFPTARMVSKFVQGRYDPLLAQNPKLADIIQNADNTTLKQIGDGIIYFSGLGSTTKEGGQFEVISVPVDGITYDEKELMKPAKVREAKERIAASPYGFEIGVSTPGLPNYGIDEDFQESDQKYWFITCPHCSFKNVIDDPQNQRFPQCIENGYLSCQNCGKDLNGYTKGEWVAKKPGIKISGYHISRLYSPFWMPKLHEIYEEFKGYSSTRDLKIFYNNVLGIPYIDTESRLSAEMILKLCTGENMLDRAAGCFMGVDIGDNKKGIHIIVMRQGPPMFQIVHMEILRAPNAQDPQAIDYIVGRLMQLVQLFGVRRMCIDAMPQPMLSRAVIYRMKGTGWMCRYNDNQKGPYKWGTEQEPKEVQVNRTESLDNWFYLLKNKLVSLPRRTEIVEEFAKHNENLVRDIEEDEDTGKRKAVWKKIGPEDFAHAGNYATIAAKYNGKPLYVGSEAVVKLDNDPFYLPVIKRPNRGY